MEDSPKERSCDKEEEAARHDATAHEGILVTVACNTSSSSSAGRRLATSPLDEEPDATRPRWHFRGIFSSRRSTGPSGGSFEAPANSPGDTEPHETPTNWLSHEGSTVCPFPAPAAAPENGPYTEEPRPTSLSAAFGLPPPAVSQPCSATASGHALEATEETEREQPGNEQSSEPGSVKSLTSRSCWTARTLAVEGQAPSVSAESKPVEGLQSSHLAVASQGIHRATQSAVLEDKSDDDEDDSDEGEGKASGRQDSRDIGRVRLRPHLPDERDRAACLHPQDRPRGARDAAVLVSLDGADDLHGAHGDHLANRPRNASRYELRERRPRTPTQDGPHGQRRDAAPNAGDRQGGVAVAGFNNRGHADAPTWERSRGPWWHRRRGSPGGHPGFVGLPSDWDGPDGQPQLARGGPASRRPVAEGDARGAGASGLESALASTDAGGTGPMEVSGEGGVANGASRSLGGLEEPGARGQKEPGVHRRSSRHLRPRREVRDGQGYGPDGRSAGRRRSTEMEAYGDGQGYGRDCRSAGRRRSTEMEAYGDGQGYDPDGRSAGRRWPTEMEAYGDVRHMERSGYMVLGPGIELVSGPTSPPSPRRGARGRTGAGGARDAGAPEVGDRGAVDLDDPQTSAQSRVRHIGGGCRLIVFGDSRTGGYGQNGGLRDAGGRGQETEEGDGLFPEEILFQIFSLLDLRALAGVAQVCRQWRRMSGQPEFWHHVDLRGCAIRLDAFAALCERQGQIQSLNLIGCPFGMDELERLGPWALVHLRGLRELSLGQCRIPHSPLTGLAAHCPSLEVLRVSEANAGCERLTIWHPHLVELELSSCTLGAVIVQCPALLTYSLCGSQTYTTELTCPQLETLDLSRCGKLSAASLQRAVVSCTRLTSLNVAGCSSVNDDTMFAVGQQCTQLTTLDASDCPNVTLDHMATWPSLHTLILRNCAGLSSASLRTLSRCPRLTALHLDSTQPLTVANVEAESLQELSLSQCPRLTGVAARCPYLERIDLSSCPALRTVEINSGSLTAFTLRSQMYLNSVKLDCPALHQLDLSECPSLSDAIFEFLAVPASCRNLTDLRLENCEGLVNAVVKADRLASISFSGCFGMKSLNLQCPSLTSLSLEGCEFLEQAELGHVLLASLNLGICPRLSALTLSSASLASLELRGCGALSTLQLACPNLSSLDASYCSKLTDTCLAQLATTCPRVSSLVLAACPEITGAGLLGLGPLQHLASLDLSYTFLTSLAPVFESCVHLRVLKLSACKLLTAEALLQLASPFAQGQEGTARGHDDRSTVTAALPELMDLDVSYTSLDAKAAEFLLMHCPRLQSISLSGCLQVTDSIWACLAQAPFPDASGAEAGAAPVRMLRSLSLVGCTKLTCVDLSSCAAVPHLTSLNLTWAKNVASVEVACPTLLSLNLSNCKSLMKVKLRCPRLTSLLLQGCLLSPTALMDAISRCTALETLDVRRPCAQVGSETLSLIRTNAPHLRRTYT